MYGNVTNNRKDSAVQYGSALRENPEPSLNWYSGVVALDPQQKKQEGEVREGTLERVVLVFIRETLGYHYYTNKQTIKK
jgi:hypothetical protein